MWVFVPQVLPVVYENLSQVIHTSDLEALVHFSEALLEDCPSANNSHTQSLTNALQNQVRPQQSLVVMFSEICSSLNNAE